MQVQELIHQTGPLPLKGGFIAGSNGPVLLVVTGSLWSNSANALLQMAIYVDNAQVGMAQIWSNGIGTHRAFSTVFIGIPSLSPGQHTVILVLPPGSPAISDVNDMFTASLIY
jgi:hypothetical protein